MYLSGASKPRRKRLNWGRIAASEIINPIPGNGFFELARQHRANNLGADEEAPKKTSWADALTSLVGAAGTAYNAAKLQKINLERAKKGLEPIDSSAVAPTVNVGLPKDLKNMLMVGGIGLGALLLVMILKRK